MSKTTISDEHATQLRQILTDYEDISELSSDESTVLQENPRIKQRIDFLNSLVGVIEDMFASEAIVKPYSSHDKSYKKQNNISDEPTAKRTRRDVPRTGWMPC